MMKKFLLIMVLAAVLLTGCRNENEKPPQELEDINTKYSDVLMTVLSKEWKAAGGDAVYKFEKDGTGNISGKNFTYCCGFTKENEMVLQIAMTDTEEKTCYYVTTDATGYGLYLNAPEKEEIYLLQTSMEVLGVSDERSAGVPGEWADKSDNRYVLYEDRTMVIRHASGETTEGTYSVAERVADGERILTLVFNGNTLDYSYALSPDHREMTLFTPGTDAVHVWTKIK